MEVPNCPTRQLIQSMASSLVSFPESVVLVVIFQIVANLTKIWNMKYTMFVKVSSSFSFKNIKFILFQNSCTMKRLNL